MEIEIAEDAIFHDSSPTEEQPPATIPEQTPTKAQASNAEAIKLQNNLKARKRTKTGCLTCRKRRIKCGEERPTCANCIKSKRSCEGYAPRLTFKDPLGAVRPGWAVKGHGAHYQNFSTASGLTSQYARPPLTPGAQGLLPAIAPRPLPLESPNNVYLARNAPPSQWTPERPIFLQDELPRPVQPSNDALPKMVHSYERRHSSSDAIPQHEQLGQTTSISSNPYPPVIDNPTSLDPLEVKNLPPVPQWQVNTASTSTSNDSIQTPSTYSNPSTLLSFVDNHYNMGTFKMSDDSIMSYDIHAARPSDQRQPVQHRLSRHSTQTFPESAGSEWTTGTNGSSQNDARYGLSAHVYEPTGYVSNIPEQRNTSEKLRRSSLQWTPVTDDPDDDLFDVESDDEGVAVISRIASTPQNDVGLMLALAASQDDRVLRSYTTFLDVPNILSTYQPTYTASPLMDSTTARVFCHFITATAPSLSIYERHPMNPSVMFTGAPVPSSQQSLWTYTLPMKALSNQALLHAMLALASLHIASLQKTPQTASLRHYHYALRRLTKILSIPAKRTDIGTIAATLILGHYEATSAEHSKWNRHLAGARQLLMEVNFKGMTKQAKEKRVRREAQTALASWQSPERVLMDHHNFHRRFDSEVDDTIDENLVSRIMGWTIRYDGYGHLYDESNEHQSPSLTERDWETSKTLSDLFWWYAKQDVYQSVVSANRLLLPYDRWGHCPPRAPIGKLEAIYGTMDHLVLLMGRIADFASKDQARKRKVMEANGGHWRPPPGMFPSPPAGSQPQNGSPPQVPGSNARGMPPPSLQPPMYGMIPNIPVPETPERFTQVPREQIYVPQTQEDDYELEEATIEAGNEWREIQTALDLFERSLGTEWRALPDYLAPPFQTAFGPALQYRTWSISCIWAMYYTGRIIAARSHPSMPPATMMAAGVAAAQTAQWANEVCRICCGLQIPPPEQPLNPALGAALMESTLSMFFAGVQLVDPLQRRAAVTRLRTIAEMTGQQSSALIAAGCELCWTKMGEAGRGPPYKPTINKNSMDHRVSGKPAMKGDELDRQMIYVHAGTRVHYAMGVMSMEEDFRDLRIVKR
ncbi:hypothetical protein MMC13_006889 [Lambiella insularis]|nr:hypothetical protein [Lambiella insularis]